MRLRYDPEYCDGSLDYVNEDRETTIKNNIISDLETMEFQGCDKVIALIDSDLFIPVFSFVLGEANVGGRKPRRNRGK